MSQKVTALDLAHKYVDEAIDAEKKQAGLAETFFETVKAKMREVDPDGSLTAKEKVAAFDTMTKEMEEYARKQIDESGLWEPGTPLSTAVPNYRVVKSHVRGGIKAGMDVFKFAKFTQFKTEKLGKNEPEKSGFDLPGDKSGGKTDKAGDGGDTGASGDKGGSPGDTAKGDNVTPIDPFAGLSSKARASINVALAALRELPENEQEEIANGFCGRSQKARKALNKGNPAMGKAAANA